MNIKFMFLNLPNIGDYINTINLHFSFSKILLYEAKIPGETNFFQVFYVFCPLVGYK